MEGECFGQWEEQVWDGSCAGVMSWKERAVRGTERGRGEESRAEVTVMMRVSVFLSDLHAPSAYVVVDLDCLLFISTL